MKKFLIAIVMVLGISSVAFAQYVSVSFSDIQNDSWYSGAVSSLVSKDIIKGYADHTFRPLSNVTRAEMAVMLDRLNNYIEHPAGQDPWTVYNNNTQGYSVAYPHDWKVAPQEKGTVKDAETGQYYYEDLTYFVAPDDELFWQVAVHDGSKFSLEDLMNDTVETLGARETRQEFFLNNLKAIKITETHVTDPSTYVERIFIEANGKIFILTSDADQKNNDFEHFVTSFVAIFE